jgi:aminocarboxymuconate-semialdehyde decarboxylase
VALVIDTHSHILPGAWVTPDPIDGRPTRYRVEVRPRGGGPVLHRAHGDSAGFDLDQLIDPERRLDDMADRGIDRQVLSVPPPFGFVYGLEPVAALAICRAFNNALAALRAHPSRAFLALATVPIQDPAAAVRELDRAAGELGLDGLAIGSHAGPMDLDDPGLRPLFDRIESLQLPLFIHSTNALAGDRLGRYHLGNVIGNPTEDAIAAASLIFGGVLDEHPGLRVYLAHGGGSYPLLHGRWSRGWAVRPEARARLARPPSEYRSRLIVDSLTHDLAALRYVVETVGVGQVVLGSDYPYDMAEPDPVARIQALTELGPGDRDRILGGTAAGLFRRAVS